LKYSFQQIDHNWVNKIVKYITDWLWFHVKMDSAWPWTRHLWPKSDGQIHPKKNQCFSNTKFVDNELFASHHQLNLKTKEGKNSAAASLSSGKDNRYP